MRIKTHKERTGWGKWSTIITYKCDKCKLETRVRKNWHGPAPIGAFRCLCGNHITF